MDQKRVVFGRVAENLFTGLESVGGFYESMMHIGVMFVFFFQQRLFKSSFMRQVYQIPVTAVSSEPVRKYHEDEMTSHIDANDVLDESFLKTMLNYILTRTRFRYGYKDIFEYLTKCLCIRGGYINFSADEKDSNKPNKLH
jgi:hypothetical protein